MLKFLASLFKAPQPSGPPQTIRVFRTADPTITRASIEVHQDAWLLDAKKPETFRLFEVNDPEAQECLIIYRATIKCDELVGRAFLEMWCRFPGQGEFFSKGLHQTVSGTTGWASYEIPFHLKKGQQPDLIKLNVAVEGIGKVWLQDIELLKTPLRS
jgi:hypothetical protein